MKRLGYLALILVALALAGCTAGSQSPTQPSLADNGRASAFVLSDAGSLYEGTGTAFTAEQRFDAMTGQTLVSVRATGANGLKSAALTLGYPAESLSLVKADYAGGLGEDVVSAIIARSPEVHLGAAIINLGKRKGMSGECELFTLVFEPGVDTPFKVSAKAPGTSANAVTITGTINVQNQVTLRWSELNRGDGNNDGKVTIADITPLARNFNDSTTDGQGDLADVLADYDNNGTVGITDLSSLAMNFNNELKGYDVQTGTMSTGPFTRIPNSGTPADPTVLRTDINPNPQPDNGPLQYVYTTQPIDGIVYFRVIPKDPQGNEGVGSESNVLMMQSLANILSLTIEPPAGEDSWLVLTEEVVDMVVGNEQPFAKNTIQLSAMGMVEGETNPVDVTNSVEWSLESGSTFATIGNTKDTNKGLLTASDLGVVSVLVRKSDDFTVSASIQIPVYAIRNITLRVVGQTTPADVSVAKGTPVILEAICIFDDNDADNADTKEITITPFVSWAIGRPLIAPGPPPVYEAGAFNVYTQTGTLVTTDAGLQPGFKAFITVVFPPEAVTPTIGEGYRANSNMLTVTLE